MTQRNEAFDIVIIGFGPSGATLAHLLGLLGVHVLVLERDAPPVFEFAEQALDEIAPAVFRAIVRDGYAAVALGGDDRLDARCCDFRADGVGVIALVDEQRVDPVAEHPEQRAKALHVVRLARCQDEAERSALSVAAGVELGGEAAARPAEPPGLGQDAAEAHSGTAYTIDLGQRDLGLVT